MPVDASIYSQLVPQRPVEGPLDQYGRAMQIKNLMGAGQLQGLQIGEAQRGIEEKQRLRDLFAGGATPTPEQVYAVSPTAGAAYQKSQAEAKTAHANLLKQDSELIKAFSENAKRELLTVTDQPTWDKYRALQKQRASLLSTPQFQQAALQALQNDPEQFDPAVIQAKLSAEAPVPAGHTRLPGGGLSPIDPNYLSGREAVAAAGKPVTKVDVKVENKTGESLAKPIGEMVQGTKDTALAALDQLDSAQRVRAALDSGKVIVGPAADARLSIAQLGQALGVGGKRVEETLVNTRNIIKGLAEFTLSARKQLKGQGQVSDFESKLIEKASSGDIASMTVPEIRTLVDVSDRLARKSYALHEKNLNTLRKGPHKELVPYYEVPPLPAPINTNPPKAGSGIKFLGFEGQ